jgi:hypothetical protein
MVVSDSLESNLQKEKFFFSLRLIKKCEIFVIETMTEAFLLGVPYKFHDFRDSFSSLISR